MKRLIVFDIDGTLSTSKSGAVFRKTADDWQWLPGRIERLRELRERDVQIAFATNQAGVAFPWSRFSEQEMQAVLDSMAKEVGASFVGVCYTSPNEKALPAYRNGNDARRKPGPGMLLEAMQHCGVKAQDTLFVGDRAEDEQAAQAAGVEFIWAYEYFNDVVPQ